MLKSTDGGATWISFTEFSDDEDNKSIDDLVSYGDHFFLASSNHGLYRSHKDSARWELVKPFGTPQGVDDNVMDVLVSENRIYLAVTSGIEYSDDDGETWTHISNANLGFDAGGLLTNIEVLDDKIVGQIAEAGNLRIVLIENLSGSTVINNGLTEFDNATRFASLRTTSESTYGKRISDDTTLWQYNLGMQSSANERTHSLNNVLLAQNYPNPFYGETRITFELTHPTETKMRIYNLLGQEIITLQEGLLPAGIHTISFDGTKFGAGVYLYTLETRHGKQIRQMSLL